MNLLNAKTTWTNKEFIPFKLCIASFYVIVGSSFHDFFERYYIPVSILFIVTVVWTVVLWLKKMRTNN